MFFSLSQIIQALLRFRYLVLFPIVVFEGPIATVLAGFLISLGYFNFWLAYSTIIVADLAGDWLHYAVGRWGRKKFIDRWGKYLSITNERVLRLEKHFENHKGKTLALGKISHGVGGVVLVAAGAARMPLGEFLFINLLVTLPKSLALLAIGYYFGEAYARINTYLEYTAIISFGIALLAMIIYYFYFPRKNNEKNL